MSYCFNPFCSNPQNASDAKCQHCGADLRLQNRYRALKQIGQGGFGRTFLAVDEADPLKPRCVIKQFFPQQGIDDREKASNLFHQEVARLKELGHHAQIPGLLADLEQDGHQYLIQAFVDGRNLEQELGEEGCFNEAKIRDLLRHLLPVVQFMHQRQVIHRDIKPANIIRQQVDSTLFLVDLGAAKYVTGTVLGKTGTVIGSAEYMAPEQTRGKPEFASDLYSLGVTCVHLLTGMSPFDLFDGSSDRWVWRDYLQIPVSPAFGDILDKLLQRATNRRYQSAAEVLADLSSPPDPAFIRFFKEHAPVMFAGLVMTIAIGQGILLLQNSHPPTPISTPPIPAFPLPTFIPFNGSSAKPKFTNLVKSIRAITLSTEAKFLDSLAISPDGQTIVGTYRIFLGPKTFRSGIDVWNLQTGELRFSLGNFSSVYNPSVSPNSQILAASREDNTVKLWDLSTGELLNTLSGTDSYGKNMIGWAADGNVITKDSKIESVRLWNSKTGEKIGAFGAPDADFGRVESISTSADGNTLVIGYENGAIRTWDLPSKKMLIVIKNPDGYVSTRTQISADRRILVSRSQTNQLTLWNLLKPGSLTQEIVTHELLEGSDEDSSSLTIDSFAFNQEQNLLVCGLGDGTLKLWDLRTGELLRIVVAHAEEVESVVFGPDGKTLITASRDKTVKIWQLDQLTKGK